MKRKLISSVAVFLVMALFFAPIANAGIQASYYLYRYYVDIYPEGEGNISIWFEVEGTDVMDEIGALSIRLQEKSSTSSTWSTVETYSYTDYSNMLGYNDNLYISSVDYSGKDGYYYRAEVTIWAGKDGDGDSRVILTDTVVA
jgi:hypothetical protein